MVSFLCRCDRGAAGGLWRAVAEYPHGAPGIVRELLAGPSVVCDPVEAQQALAWARAHPAWVEEPAPLFQAAGDPDRTAEPRCAARDRDGVQDGERAVAAPTGRPTKPRRRTVRTRRWG